MPSLIAHSKINPKSFNNHLYFSIWKMFFVQKGGNNVAVVDGNLSSIYMLGQEPWDWARAAYIVLTSEGIWQHMISYYSIDI